MRRLALVMSIVFLFINTGCSFLNESRDTYNKYSYEFLGSFDTLIQFVGYAKSEKEFESLAKKGQARFEELHKLYDIYNIYPGINNIKTINDNAGIKPVEVEQEIIDIILFSKEWNKKTDGTVNIAMGPVLSIWHDFREEGSLDPAKARLPEIEVLKKAQEKTDIEKVIVDIEKKTVFLQEQGMKLDVGAVAKGFATEIVAQELIDEEFDSFVISSGGNVRTVGEPLRGDRNMWEIGIQDPNGNPLIPDESPLDVVYINDGSVVTSGDYQRYYKVNGQIVHHLIDPTTLMPANHYREVTVTTKDSGIADFLSTTVFLLPYEKSRALVESLEGVEALWIMYDGSMVATEGMKNSLKKMGK